MTNQQHFGLADLWEIILPNYSCFFLPKINKLVIAGQKKWHFSLQGSKYGNIARGTTDPEIDSVTWTKLGNNMAPFALVANLTTRWRHLHKLQIWPPDDHQVESLALLHCLGLPFWHYQIVLSWYLHQPESHHQLSFKKLSQSVTDIRTQRSDPRFTWVR